MQPAINFGLLIMPKNYAENEAGRLVPDLYFFEKAYYEVKASGLRIGFGMFQ